jgi:hypothetical protein
MIFAGFSIAKLLGGFNLFNGEKLGKMLYYLAIIAVCLGVFWKLFIAPTHNQNQQAESITNITEQKEDGFSLIKIKILGWGN